MKIGTYTMVFDISYGWSPHRVNTPKKNSLKKHTGSHACIRLVASVCITYSPTTYIIIWITESDFLSVGYTDDLLSGSKHREKKYSLLLLFFLVITSWVSDGNHGRKRTPHPNSLRRTCFCVPSGYARNFLRALYWGKIIQKLKKSSQFLKI